MRMRFIAVSMVSWSGLLVKRLVISKEPKQFWEIFGILTWENLHSLQGQSLGTNSERRSQRKRARFELKVSIDEIIGQSLRSESLEKNFYILGVP